MNVGRVDSSLFYFNKGFALLTKNWNGLKDPNWNDLLESIHPQVSLDLLQKYMEFYNTMDQNYEIEELSGLLEDVIPKLIDRSTDLIQYGRVKTST